MKTIKQKPRKGYAFIEVLVVLIISLWSIIIIVPSISHSNLQLIDSQIFSTMMKSVHTNSPQSIYVDDELVNTYYPSHAFSKSFRCSHESFEVTFYIGRGYYAFKERP